MFRRLRYWHKHTIIPLIARQSTLAYDMTYWRTRTLKREILKAVIGLVAICVGGVVVVIFIIANTRDAVWLAYVFAVCTLLICLAGIQPLVYRLWLIATTLKKRRAAKKVRH
jgi:hypothetical protein